MITLLWALICDYLYGGARPRCTAAAKKNAMPGKSEEQNTTPVERQYGTLYISKSAEGMMLCLQLDSLKWSHLTMVVMA